MERDAEAGDAWDARVHLPEILDFVKNFSGERCVHFFDVFSGVAEATKTFRGKGYETRNFDILQGDNMVSKAGFFLALNVILMMVPAGLLLLGPPCSLWVFFSSSFHKRTLSNPAGDTSKKLVRDANTLVRNVVLLLAIANYRNLFFILEQPSSSKMKNYSWLARLSRALGLRKITTWMRCFGHQIPKPTWLLSNMTTARQLRKVWSRHREMARKAQCEVNAGLLVEVFFRRFVRTRTL